MHSHLLNDCQPCPLLFGKMMMIIIIIIKVGQRQGNGLREVRVKETEYMFLD